MHKSQENPRVFLINHSKSVQKHFFFLLIIMFKLLCEMLKIYYIMYGILVGLCLSHHIHVLE